MNEEGNKSVLESMEEEPAPAEPFQGLCPSCLGSGYRIRESNGIIGVLYNSTSNDSEGKPVRRLIHCDCKVQVSY